jgi:hypothetical protein
VRALHLLKLKARSPLHQGSHDQTARSTEPKAPTPIGCRFLKSRPGWAEQSRALYPPAEVGQALVRTIDAREKSVPDRGPAQPLGEVVRPSRARRCGDTAVGFLFCRRGPVLRPRKISPPSGQQVQSADPKLRADPSPAGVRSA